MASPSPEPHYPSIGCSIKWRAGVKPLRQKGKPSRLRFPLLLSFAPVRRGHWPKAPARQRRSVLPTLCGFAAAGRQELCGGAVGRWPSTRKIHIALNLSPRWRRLVHVFEAGVVERMIGRARQLSQLQAALLADLVAVADATPNPEFAGFEISSALTWTRRAADTQLDLAHTIVRRLPSLHAAMAAGDVDLPKARVIVDGVAALDLDLARDHRGGDPAAGARVDHRRAAAPAGQTGHRRRPGTRRPNGAKPGCVSAGWSCSPPRTAAPTCSGLDLPAEDALAATNRLTALARALKQAGDPRSLDQLRADTFLNLLLGNTCSHHSPRQPSPQHSLTGSSSAAAARPAAAQRSGRAARPAQRRHRAAAARARSTAARPAAARAAAA